ncbi:MAG: permease, partial [bacterium]
MNKEPIGLYLFRFVVGLGMLAFMAMLYWSSVLVEDNLQDLRVEIADLKNDVDALRTETDSIRDEVLRTLLRQNVSDGKVPSSELLKQRPREVSSTFHRPHIDPSLPNLLEEDAFYLATLPKLLGENYKPHGTLHGATIGKPNNLHPFSNWSQVSSWVSQCSVALARLKFGKYETFAPDMAIKIEARERKGSKNPEFWVHLRDEVYWQPLSVRFFSEDIQLAPQFLREHQVTADDYKFFFDALMNPYFQEAGAVSLRNYLGDIEEIEVLDKLTFVVRWKAYEVPDEGGHSISKIKY